MDCKTNFLLAIIISVCLIITCIVSNAQNVAITDDDGYTAHSSAMLDVKSLTKGMLIPRMTTAQMNAISSPAAGLLIFNTTDLSFYFYNGSVWVDLSSGSDVWELSGSDVYLSDPNHDVGIGVSTPAGKLEVKGDAEGGLETPLFAVVNNNEDTVFAVYPEGVRIWVDDNGAKASGSKGGFAVGGFSQGKGLTDDYLFVEREQSRVYVDGDQGFSVGDINTGSSVEYLDMTPENYFIGHQSGQAVTSGFRNSFMGYQSGYSTTTGSYNTFLGYRSGYSNIGGGSNLFLGYESGFANTSGNYNTFIGYQCGHTNTTGSQNLFLGYRSGYSNSSGTGNLFIGTSSGYANSDGENNTFIGHGSGDSNTGGDNNLFIGTSSGQANTTGQSNIFLGYFAGYANTTGFYNICIGTSSGSGLTTGARNVFVGEQTGWSSNAHNNTYLGYNAGRMNSGGGNNVFIGYSAGYNGTSGAGNVFIGYNAGYYETGSNLLYIANSDTELPLIYGDFSTNFVQVNGNLHPNGILYDSGGDAGTSGQVLSSTGSATNWIDPPTGVTGSGLANRVAFWNGPSSVTYDNNFVWDNTNKRLGIGITSPLYKIHAENFTTNNDDPAVYGRHFVTDNWGIGVRGDGMYRGVYGYSENNTDAGSATGVYGYASSTGSATTYGVYGYAYSSGTSYAGYFDGSVYVAGTLSKSAGTFMIDHPMDPENKYLVHSFVESPDMMNIYNGVVILDSQGKATVTLPDYFEVLNKDFRYQLTPIGVSAPNLFIAQKVSGNQFVIAGGEPGMEVSWEVTGVRKDPYAEANRVVVEPEKKTNEKGKYLNPELYNMPESKKMHSVQTDGK